MSNKIGGFAPDIGLEYIARSEDKPLTLPAQKEAQLTGTQVRQRIEELFGRSSLEQTIRHFVSPQLSNPAILIPARFETLVRESALSLSEQAKTSTNPALQRAGELLEHEVRLRDLLSSYRSMLMEA
jgi:hypothetical protein